MPHDSNTAAKSPCEKHNQIVDVTGEIAVCRSSNAGHYVEDNTLSLRILVLGVRASTELKHEFCDSAESGHQII